MLESVLKLNQEIPWSPGIKQDYGIMSDTGKVVGRLSVTRFSIEKPFKTNWLYVNNVEIPDIVNRGNGFAYKAMLEVNKLIENEQVNGVLKNSIMDRKRKDYYQNLGWNKIPGVTGPWEFLLNQPLSVFLVRQSVDLIRENFVR